MYTYIKLLTSSQSKGVRFYNFIVHIINFFIITAICYTLLTYKIYLYS